MLVDASAIRAINVNSTFISTTSEFSCAICHSHIQYGLKGSNNNGGQLKSHYWQPEYKNTEFKNSYRLFHVLVGLFRYKFRDFMTGVLSTSDKLRGTHLTPPTLQVG